MGLEHPISCPSPGSTQSSADFITTRIISWPHGSLSGAITLQDTSWSPCQLLGTCHQSHNKDLPVRAPGLSLALGAGSSASSGCWLQALAPSWLSPLLPRASVSPHPPPQPLISGFQTQGDQLPSGKAVKHPAQRPLQSGSGITKSAQGWADPAQSPLELPCSPQALNPLPANADKAHTGSEPKPSCFLSGGLSLSFLPRALDIEKQKPNALQKPKCSF